MGRVINTIAQPSLVAARGCERCDAGNRLRTRRLCQQRRQWRCFCNGERRKRANRHLESIDGPPPQIFERMVSVLDSESKLRNLSIVSRAGTASYRVRSYLAAQVNRGRATIAWVWDVYDQNQQRALRLSGEEPAGKAGRDAWAAADDMVLRKIAQAGLSGLSSMINGTAPAEPPQAPPSAPTKRGPAVAGANPPSLASADFGLGALSYTSH